MLHAREFVELEKRALAYRRSDAQTSDGQDKLLALYVGLAAGEDPCAPADMDEERSVHRALLEEWRAKSTMPEVAVMALADMESRQAWLARGDGYASTVTGEQFRTFRLHLEKSLALLKTVKEARKTDPFWYAKRLRLALEMGEGKASFNKLFKEALATHPHFTDYFHIKARYLSPIWHGSPQEFAAFVDAAERHTGNKHGPEVLYARLYVTTPVIPMQAQHPVTIRRVKAGLEELLRRHPGPYNRNRYAKFLCQLKMYPELFEEVQSIGRHVSSFIWDSETSYHACWTKAMRWRSGLDPEAFDQTPTAPSALIQE